MRHGSIQGGMKLEKLSVPHIDWKTIKKRLAPMWLGRGSKGHTVTHLHKVDVVDLTGSNDSGLQEPSSV